MLPRRAPRVAGFRLGSPWLGGTGEYDIYYQSVLDFAVPLSAGGIFKWRKKSSGGLLAVSPSLPSRSQPASLKVPTTPLVARARSLPPSRPSPPPRFRIPRS